MSIKSYLIAICTAALIAGGCKSPEAHRLEADKQALAIISHQQKIALGRTEPFSVESPADTLRRRLLIGQDLPISSPASLGVDRLEPVKHWPEKDYLNSTTQPATTQPVSTTLKMTLLQALQVSAKNSRDYQSQKENVFRAALGLDLESREFRNTYAALLAATASHNESGARPVGGVTGEADTSISRRLKSGATLTGRIGVDLVKLLTRGYDSTLGLFAETSIDIPLLRGSARHIVTEPLTQAQRNVVYAIYTFERLKRTIAVGVASEYLGVLRRLDEVANAHENYRQLKASADRARNMANEDRLTKVEVDQAYQNELSARDRWVRAQDAHARALDNFKITLSLPTDARIELDREELLRLSEQTSRTLATADGETAPKAADDTADPTEAPTTKAGPMEMPEAQAIKVALANRLDLRTLEGRIFDAQRGVVVAADGLKADITLGGSAAMGSSRSLSTAASDRGDLRPERGTYSASLSTDLPWERTSERNTYRSSFITLERATRNVQELEDRVKLQVRSALRVLKQTRESSRIQALAVKLAERRVESTRILLEIGRAQIRDVLEAQEALISAQNALTAAMVNYRVAELELQRDMGVLEVNEKGLWREYRPDAEN